MGDAEVQSYVVWFSEQHNEVCGFALSVVAGCLPHAGTAVVGNQAAWGAVGGVQVSGAGGQPPLNTEAAEMGNHHPQGAGAAVIVGARSLALQGVGSSDGDVESQATRGSEVGSSVLWVVGIVETRRWNPLDPHGFGAAEANILAHRGAGDAAADVRR